MKFMLSYIMDEVGYSDILEAKHEEEAMKLLHQKLVDQYPDSSVSEMICSKYVKPTVQKKLKRVAACVGFLLMMMASAVYAETLTWIANQESDLAGYKVYRSTVSGVYGAPIATLGKVTTYNLVLPQLQVDTTYFMVITSYDFAGNESGKSNEVSKMVPAAVVIPPTVTLAVRGVPATGSWSVEALTNVIGTYAVEFSVNGVVERVEGGGLRCLVGDVNGSCVLTMRPAGTYVVSVRLLVGGLSVATASTTVVVPDIPPAPPTLLQISQLDDGKVMITADASCLALRSEVSNLLQQTVECVQ